MFKSLMRFVYLLGVVYIPVSYCIARAAPEPAPAPAKPKMGIVSDHLNSAGKQRTRIVSIKYGDLRGFVVNLPGKQFPAIEVFLGVPYASPPISALRFMPPVTPSHWKGVLSADRFSPVCPQRLPDIEDEAEALKYMPVARLEYLKRLFPHLKNQSEDCLYLNIYAPQRSK
ncbi:neuroligin 4-like [Caerostris darwini]|uniref:Neuroligin 4-like n=1 Tax=Caerostris darwini TaxID=1538125 RepID=A0AAV4MIZ4_9ARAC|nr:neuroligin 4-like [Caerostris darwini]